jgi:hypothetical protein
MTFIAGILVSICLNTYACGPYQATGIKIGEVTCNSAIIWMRLSANAERIVKEGGMQKVQYLEHQDK